MDAQVHFPGDLPPELESAGPSRCPMCRGEVEPDAIRCQHCGDLLAHFKICPRCAEKVHEDAQTCRHCSHDFEREAERRSIARALSANPHHLVANPFGVLFSEMSLTGLFFPPELTISGDEVKLTRWTMLGLRRLDQRISTRKIASVRYLSGVIWGGLMVETFGGALSDLVVHGLDKTKATETARLLEQMITDA
jgi:Double zinc ribbon